MPDSLDSLSYVAVEFGGAGNPYVIIPAMTGSSATEDNALQKVFLAGYSTDEAQNFTRGLSMPGVDLLTIPHKNWFSAANLHAMFTAKTNGLLSSVGRIAYRIGSGVAADEVMGSFDKCFVFGLTLSGGAQGTPVIARLGLAPAGSGSVDFPSSGDRSALQTGAHGYFMSEGVGFGGLMTDVMRWELTLLNGLTPDATLPASGAVPLAINRIYPAKYINAPIVSLLTVVQKSGATVVDGGSLAASNSLILRLVSSEVEFGDQAVVRFRLTALKPNKAGGVSMGLTSVTRSYVGIADADDPSVVIDAV